MTNVKKWTKDNYVLIIAFAVWVAIEFLIQSTTGDEPAYQAALQMQSLYEYMKYYFETWSNRILIDVTAVGILSKPMMLFKMFNAIVFFMLLFGIKNLLVGNKENHLDEIFLVSLFFVIPYACFLDAGFTVTCIYYLWPMAAGVWCVCIVLKENSKWLLKLVGALLLVFACNMEQTALLMNGALFLICCFSLKNERRRSYPWLMFVLAVGCILFMLLGEGGNNRVLVEIGDKFPEYIGLTALQKFDMGFSTTMEHLLFEGDALWLVFVAVLFVCLVSDGSFVQCILGSIPLVFSMALGLFKEGVLAIFPTMKYLFESVGEYGVIDLSNYDLRNRWFPLLLFFVVIITVIVDLYLLETDLKKSLVLIFVFGVGFVSRLIMGFSPTIYASGNRTYYPFWIVLICLSYYLYGKMDETKRKSVTVISVLLAFVSLCSTIISLNR
ncbi:MAG: hypothetical protein IJZ76_08185 [Lachnospiraceae bacterium]|nr:hypothetical protein [Lachnospiraceae bacterium]